MPDLTNEEVIEVLEERLELAKDSLQRIVEIAQEFPELPDMRYEENIEDVKRVIHALTQAIQSLKELEEMKKRVDVEKIERAITNAQGEILSKYGVCATNKDEAQAIVNYLNGGERC